MKKFLEIALTVSCIVLVLLSVYLEDKQVKESYDQGFEDGAIASLDTMSKIIEAASKTQGTTKLSVSYMGDTSVYFLSPKTIKVKH